MAETIATRVVTEEMETVVPRCHSGLDPESGRPLPALGRRLLRPRAPPDGRSLRAASTRQGRPAEARRGPGSLDRRERASSRTQFARISRIEHFWTKGRLLAPAATVVHEIPRPLLRAVAIAHVETLVFVEKHILAEPLLSSTCALVVRAFEVPTPLAPSSDACTDIACVVSPEHFAIDV